TPSASKPQVRSRTAESRGGAASPEAGAARTPFTARSQVGRPMGSTSHHWPARFCATWKNPLAPRRESARKTSGSGTGAVAAGPIALLVLSAAALLAATPATSDGENRTRQHPDRKNAEINQRRGSVDRRLRGRARHREMEIDLMRVVHA